MVGDLDARTELIPPTSSTALLFQYKHFARIYSLPRRQSHWRTLRKSAAGIALAQLQT